MISNNKLFLKCDFETKLKIFQKSVIEIFSGLVKNTDRTQNLSGHRFGSDFGGPDYHVNANEIFECDGEQKKVC